MSNLIKIILVSAIALTYTVTAAFSAERVGKGSDTVKPSKAALKAIIKAADWFNVDSADLVRIAYIESRFNVNPKPRANTNGTVDVGMFQINSVHWSTTCKGLDVLELQGNAYCAAKLLKQAAKHSETDTNWKGRYHSKTPKLKLKYAEMIASVDVQ